MTTSLHLYVVPSQFTVEHLPNATFPEDDEWIALVRAPEGLTVVRDASPFAEAERWTGFYSAVKRDQAGPGALAGIVLPLTAADIRVFVTSTYHADLVLVPELEMAEATKILRELGVRVDD
ncbi:ACT domain-containing protein [Spirillospora sp. NBC_00431]